MSLAKEWESAAQSLELYRGGVGLGFRCSTWYRLPVKIHT